MAELSSVASEVLSDASALDRLPDIRALSTLCPMSVVPSTVADDEDIAAPPLARDVDIPPLDVERDELFEGSSTALPVLVDKTLEEVDCMSAPLVTEEAVASGTKSFDRAGVIDAPAIDELTSDDNRALDIEPVIEPAVVALDVSED